MDYENTCQLLERSISDALNGRTGQEVCVQSRQAISVTRFRDRLAADGYGLPYGLPASPAKVMWGINKLQTHLTIKIVLQDISLSNLRT